MKILIGALLLPLLLPAASFAADGLDTGDTAWMLTATALVLFMTLPGLALFYSGFVGPGEAIVSAQYGGMGLPEGVSIAQQFVVQPTGMSATIIWCGIVTFVLLKLINVMLPLRVTADEENQGLDLVEHDERGYDI